MGTALQLEPTPDFYIQDVGLAEAGGNGLEVAKKIYADTYEHRNEMTAPYATVIDIDFSKVPTPEEVNTWDSKKVAESLQHIRSNPNYNPNFRQLIHVAFKIAVNLGNTYTNALKKHA